MTSSSSTLLQYSHVVLNAGGGHDLPAFASTAAMAQHLLSREVFQYDFSKEKALVESAQARGRRNSQDAQNDEELAKRGMAILGMVDSPESKMRRRSSADDVAAAIAASLKEY
ncbi:Aste57867_12629 [Aphanomyces stellatus]|uniref:Aste57867_12629 protein n=1 Tax=Aphanomyces stellatus TaxID=120398 RepID=A0A485KWF7_9STRA|nr:hypothetical protein As57867_012583 [Aphanomyces stellatus]VFT89479.1 Aste57867_12629 [Aphanomyces stellatus]